jgi:hypothetical protein
MQPHKASMLELCAAAARQLLNITLQSRAGTECQIVRHVKSAELHMLGSHKHQGLPHLSSPQQQCGC